MTSIDTKIISAIERKLADVTRVIDSRTYTDRGVKQDRFCGITQKTHSQSRCRNEQLHRDSTFSTFASKINFLTLLFFAFIFQNPIKNIFVFALFWKKSAHLH